MHPSRNPSKYFKFQNTLPLLKSAGRCLLEYIETPFSRLQTPVIKWDFLCGDLESLIYKPFVDSKKAFSNLKFGVSL